MPRDPLTALIHRAIDGDRPAADRAFEMIHHELRRIAQAKLRSERAGHTLTPTALVHEAYLKLVRSPPDRVASREHFYGLAGRAMRQVLVDHAIRRGAAKRGGGLPMVSFGKAEAVLDCRADDVVRLDQALADLEKLDPDLARVVEYRFFAGLDQDEIASLLGVSASTVARRWRTARAWLRRSLGRSSGDPSPSIPPVDR